MKISSDIEKDIPYDISDLRYEKNKAICEFIIVFIQKIYGFDTPMECIHDAYKKTKYRQPRLILFYLIKINTGLSFRDISIQLSYPNHVIIWSAFKKVDSMRKSKTINDTIDKVTLIQSKLDEYLSKWQSKKG